MGKFIGGIVFTVLIIVIGGYIVLKAGMVDMSADQTPSRLERRLGGTALDASVAKRAADLKNPLEATDANLLEGMHIYVQNCAECHGDPKEQESRFGSALNPQAPQFMKSTPDMPENENYYIARHGVRLTGMPAWDKLLSDDQLWKVTAFLSHMEKLPAAVEQEWRNPPPAAPKK